MADISDVTARLAQMAAAAVYPSGAGQPSVAGVDVRIFEGWPIASSLDADIAAGKANVSIFPMPGGSAPVFQVLDETYVITPAVHGLSASISGDTVTLVGTPGSGEYASIVADERFAYSRVGADIPTILNAIAADAAANYQGVVVSGDSITFPTTRLVCNIGAPATAGKVTHRQRDAIFITVWAPTPALRNLLAESIDVALKAVNRLTFPDTSQGLLVASHQNQLDDRQTASIYRRDLVFTVEYATLATFQVFEVTTFNPTFDVGPSDYGSAATLMTAVG